IAFFPPKEEPEPEPDVNKAALEEAIKEAESKDAADYTESSWKAVASALEAAQTVLADEDASQDEVDEAAEALNEALANPEPDNNGGDPSIDTTALEAAIKEAESKDAADYTESSWKAVASALEAAQTVLADEDASQDEVDEATKALTKALTKL